MHLVAQFVQFCVGGWVKIVSFISVSGQVGFFEIFSCRFVHKPVPRALWGCGHALFLKGSPLSFWDLYRSAQTVLECQVCEYKQLVHSYLQVGHFAGFC